MRFSTAATCAFVKALRRCSVSSVLESTRPRSPQVLQLAARDASETLPCPLQATHFRCRAVLCGPFMPLVKPDALPEPPHAAQVRTWRPSESEQSPHPSVRFRSSQCSPNSHPLWNSARKSWITAAALLGLSSRRYSRLATAYIPSSALMFPRLGSTRLAAFNSRSVAARPSSPFLTDESSRPTSAQAAGWSLPPSACISTTTNAAKTTRYSSRRRFLRRAAARPSFADCCARATNGSKLSDLSRLTAYSCCT